MKPTSSKNLSDEDNASARPEPDGERVIWIATGLGFLLLTIYGLFVEPRLIGWSSTAPLFSTVSLFAGLAVLSCLFPVTAPRLAQRVRLLPVVALGTIFVLPPGLAALPILLAGSLTLLLQDEHTLRLQTLGMLLVLILAQMGAAMGLHMTGMLPVGLSTPPVHRIFSAFAATAVLGAVYLGGLALIHLSRREETEPHSPSWSIFWTNEALIYLFGAPFAAAIAFELLGSGGLVAAVIAIVCASLGTWICRMLVERSLLLRQVRAIEALTSSAAIGKTESIGKLIGEFLDLSRTLVLYDLAKVWLYDEDERLLICQSERPRQKREKAIAPFRMGESLVGRVAERQGPMIVPDIRRDARHSAYRYSNERKAILGPISQLLVPLSANGGLIGVAQFDRRAYAAFRETDLERVQPLATLIAMGIDNMRRHQDVVQLALTDGLTGLYNKRHILQILADEVRRAERYNHALCVLMMDVDGFKAYNDTYGHPQGDVLLTELAVIIQQSIRASDHAGRYGGEEFIVIMPETSKEAGALTAERIRYRIEQAEFAGRQSKPVNLPDELADCFPPAEDAIVHKTISIGLAAFPVDARDDTALVARADDALYQAKRSGRNRVVSAAALTLALPSEAKRSVG